MFVLESFAFEDPNDETLKAMQMGSDPEISWLVSEGSFLFVCFLGCLRACCWSSLILCFAMSWTRVITFEDRCMDLVVV